MSSPLSASSPARTNRTGLVIAVLCFGSLCSALMQCLVIPIQSDLPRLLGTSASNASWVVTATLLGGAIAMPIAGRLADVLGKKPVIVAAAITLVVGSLVCAVSNSLGPMLVGRVLQGFAMSYIAIAISMVREYAPPHLRNAAVAGVSATLGVGGALGLPLAAWIAQDYNWHALFWVSVVLAVIMVGLSLAALPRLDDAHPGHIDAVGAVGLALGLVGVLVGVSKGNDWGWGEPSTLGLIVGGIVILLVWGQYELRHAEPLIDLRTTARRAVLLTNLAAVLIGFGMMAQSIVVPQLLEMPSATGYGLDQTLLQAGLWMAPMGVVMMLFAPVSSRLLTKIGGRLTLSLGAGVLAVGYVLAIFMTAQPWQLLVASCVVGAGVGIGYAAMPTLILNNVPTDEAASSVGVNTLMRSVGTTVAGAVMAVILTSRTMTLAPGTPAIPTHDAFRLCFVVGAIAAAAGAAIVLLIPRRTASTPDDVDGDSADAGDAADDGIEPRDALVVG